MDVKIIENDFPKIDYLKDGTKINIRLMTKEDTNRILEFFAKIPGKDKLYLRENVSDENAIKQDWIRKIEEGTGLTILGFINNKLIGEAALIQNTSGWSKHVGYIRINVAKKQRGKGIATVLASEIYNIAVKTGFEKICAQIIREQKEALDIFKKLGFKEEALLKNHVKDHKGKKHDLILLSNDPSELLKEIIRHMQFSDMRYGQEY